jgi:hypothetical protein
MAKKRMFLSWKIKEPLDPHEAKGVIAQLRREYARLWLDAMGLDSAIENNALPSRVHFCCSTVDPAYGLEVPECISCWGRIDNRYLGHLTALLERQDVHVEICEDTRHHDHYPYTRRFPETPPIVGAWVQFVSPVEQNSFRVEPSATGVVDIVEDNLISVKVAQYMPGAQAWNNSVTWTLTEAGTDGSILRAFYSACRLITQKPVKRLREGEYIVLEGQALDPQESGLDRDSTYVVCIESNEYFRGGRRLKVRLETGGPILLTLPITEDRSFDLLSRPFSPLGSGISTTDEQS